MEPQYLGNMNLLSMRKVGFFASRHTAPASVLPTLDWANEIRRNPEVAVVSGFQSPLERQVLDIILQGRCGIIYILNRCIYRRIPGTYATPISQNRILFISLISNSSTRPSKEQAAVRNRYIADISDELTLSSVIPSSSLFPLLEIDKQIRQL